MEYNIHYEIARCAIKRCVCQSDTSYKNYGGRGITVYEAWRHSPKAFCDYILRTIGERPSPRHQLDRINNSVGYYPGNIRWSTRKDNCRNKRTNKTFVIGGEVYCLAELAEKFSINRQTLMCRLKGGMSVDEAVRMKPSYANRTKPVDRSKCGNKRNVVFNGETMPLAMAARLSGLKPTTVSKRVNKYKWDISRALSTPV